MTIQIVAPVTSLGQLLTRRHDQLQELVPDDDHLQYMVGLGADILDTQVINTNVETTIASVNLGPLDDAGLLPTELLWILWRGYVLNNTGVDQTLKMFLKTSVPQTLGETAAIPLATSAIARGCGLNARWQQGRFRGDVVANFGAAITPPVMGAVIHRGFTVFDLAGLQAGSNLLVRVQFGAADANLFCTNAGLWVGKCRGPR